MDAIYGTESFVLHSSRFNPFRHDLYGEETSYTGYLFGLKAWYKSRGFDIVHVHDFDKLVEYVEKPTVLHYHGSFIRGRWDEKKKAINKAKQVLVSTGDLYKQGCLKYPHVKHIPRPVATHLLPKLHEPTLEAFHTYRDDTNASFIAKEYADLMDISLELHNQEENPIHHKEFLELLNQFEYYIDVKKNHVTGSVIPELSLTGLEALAMGLKVIDYGGMIWEGLPRINRPDFVAKQVYKVYEEIL